MTAVAALTDNTEAQQTFQCRHEQGLCLPVDDLDVASVMETDGSDFYTVLISSDFDDADIDPTQSSSDFDSFVLFQSFNYPPDTFTVAGVTFTAQAGATTWVKLCFRAAARKR